MNELRLHSAESSGE